MTFKCNFIINHTRVVHHSQIVLHEIQSANVLMWIDFVFAILDAALPCASFVIEDNSTEYKINLKIDRSLNKHKRKISLLSEQLDFEQGMESMT